METTTPISPPQEEVENDNQQPSIAGSPSQAAVPLLFDDVDNHQQFMYTNSPSFSPQQQAENLRAGQLHPPPEDVEYRQVPPVPPLSPPVVNIDDQPPLTLSSHSNLLQPPTAESKQPSDILYPNYESPISKPLPSPPQTGGEQLLENLSPDCDSLISNQLSSVLPSTPPIGVEDHVERPNSDINPYHEAPILQQFTLPPPTEAEQLPGKLNPSRDSPISNQPPSPLPSTPVTGADDHVESPKYNVNPNPESPISRNSPPPSVPRPPTEVEQLPENLNDSRESPISMQPLSPLPSTPPIGVEDYAEIPSYHMITNYKSPISSNTPTLSPPPASTEDEQLRESPISYQPPPPSTGAEQLQENVKPNHNSPNPNQPLSLSTPPSLSLSTLPAAAEDHVESPNYSVNSNPNHESPILKQLLSPSHSPPQTGAEDLDQSPNYDIKPSINHESPNAKQPLSLSQSPPQTVAKKTVQIANYNENISANHDSQVSKQPPSPLPPTPCIGAEDHVENPNHDINPNPKTHDSPKDLSPSLPLTAASPSSPHDTPELTTPPLAVPLYLHVAVSSAPSRPQISPWTPEETANLIQAYQEKWYSLKKGPLKAGQWEEVAITVAARCGYDEPTKTAKQCRHKIEKLRKRYRAERGKPRSKANAWNFFKLMDNLEKGPLPISSSRPTALVEYEKPSNSKNKKRKNEEFAGNGEFHRRSSSGAKNTNHHIPNGGLARNIQFPERVVRGLRTPMIHKRKGFYQEQRDDDEEEEEHGVGGNEEGVGAQLAAEIKRFAEKFVKMENKKIEMIRDVERYRLEMENKRVEMILESQQMLVETVNNAFS